MTLRRWFNQVGYYKLNRKKTKADDWFYLIDNEIRLENKKACLILGGRLSQIKKGVPLTFKLLEPCELRICTTKEDVKKAIKSAIKKNRRAFDDMFG